MTPERQLELSQNLGAELTDEEMAEGWHFSCEWDGLLIHPDSAEGHCCQCSVCKAYFENTAPWAGADELD